MQVDVIIIGSGPAGCAAAIRCRQQGLHTLIISPGQSRKQGKSSESIHPGVLSVLEQLQAAHCVAAATQGVYEGIDTGAQTNLLGEDAQGIWQGYHINRDLFDAALLDTALRQGAMLQDNHIVTGILTGEDRIRGVVTRNGMQMYCRYIIDASGQAAVSGKLLHFTRSFYSPPLVTWTGVCEAVPAGIFDPGKNNTQFIPYTDGWTWLAQEAADRCTWTRLAAKGRQQLPAPEILQDCRAVGPVQSSNRRWRLFRPVCKEGILLCGDAAGILDPAAGQGILNALLSAIHAAGTVQQCISDPVWEALYLARYDTWFCNTYEAKVHRLKYFYNLHGITVLQHSMDLPVSAGNV